MDTSSCSLILSLSTSNLSMTPSKPFFIFVHSDFGFWRLLSILPESFHLSVWIAHLFSPYHVLFPVKDPKVATTAMLNSMSDTLESCVAPASGADALSLETGFSCLLLLLLLLLGARHDAPGNRDRGKEGDAYLAKCRLRLTSARRHGLLIAPVSLLSSLLLPLSFPEISASGQI